MDEREILLAAVDALNRRDMDDLRKYAHPEFAFHPLRAPMTGDYHGYTGLEKFLADNAETFEEFRAEYDDVRILPDGRGFASGRVRVRGIGSQVDQLVPSAGITTFRDGLLASWYDYGDRSAALAAAGLEDS